MTIDAYCGFSFMVDAMRVRLKREIKSRYEIDIIETLLVVRIRTRCYLIQEKKILIAFYFGLKLIVYWT